MSEVNATPTAPIVHALDIRHGLLAPSPTNPRKRFDPAVLAELADSIAEHGVMTPLAARPNPLHTDGDGRPPYEIVCGERRWRACGLLIEQGRAYPGDGTVPALVRDYTDAQVLALQALENVQRQDLHPLEEADHYHLMVTHPRNPASVAEVAQLIGKSTSYVQARLNLRRLGTEARQAFMDGLLDFSKALRVSAMPAAQQPGIVQHITTWGGEPMGVRAAERFIVEQHTLLLTRAPWNLADADLVPEAGACTDCGHRTDRQPGLFEVATDGDRCMDGACWARKRQAHHDWLVRNAEAEGYVIARGDRASAIMRSDSTVPADGWHDLSARVPAHLGDSTMTVEQVIDRAAVPAEDITVLDQPSRERLVHLVTTATLRTALAALGAGKSDRPDLELQAQQPQPPKSGKATPPAADPRADGATDGAPPRVPPKAAAQPEQPAWDPLDDLLAFDVLPPGRCDDAMTQTCRERAISRTAAALATHRACIEVRERGGSLNLLMPAALAGLLGSTLVALAGDDTVETLQDVARLAGIDQAPPAWDTSVPWTVHSAALRAWAQALDRMDATCLTVALLALEAEALPDGPAWRHVASAVGLTPAPLLAQATQAVDERLRVELLARSAAEPATPKRKATTKPAAKAGAKAKPQAGKAPEKAPAKPKAAAKATAKPASKAAAAKAVKYRNAATGETWTGRGLQPAWMKKALADGAKLSDFEVQP